MSPTENRQTAKRATAKRLQTTLTSKLASSGSDKSNKEEFKKLDEECNNSVEPANSECTSVSEHFEVTDAARECASPLSGITATKLMRTLATKKREFFHMRKRLFSQQYALIELFATLKELESRIGASGEDQLGEMRVLSVTQWPAHDLLLLVREDLTPPTDSDLNSLIGHYCQQLMRLKQEVEKKRPELINRKSVIFHYINARPHASIAIQQILRKFCWEVNPPYSTDLLPLDFHLFRYLQNSLGFEVLERQREELDSILGEVTAMAEELISRRVALVNFIRDKYKVERLTFSKNQEWKTKNLEIDNETEQIQKHVVDVVTNTRKRVSRIMEIAKIPWIDRETLVKKLEKAHREALVLQNKLQDNVKKYGDTPQNHKQSLISEKPKAGNVADSLGINCSKLDKQIITIP
ncbi:Histone-lysine N-methyltransferase SETMAR [Eumeta japonica]|uniref:Histone-lysine N-methyltransferase SETMAR n=1 Tax=Eumeta variegata TaxID=151549 RepID=A0A4C1TT63_EUMVA|nr:Histone-lysine N-methyltransferase SETMAR [Eumeta japonica]